MTGTSTPPRRFLPQPVETTSRKQRTKLAVESVEDVEQADKADAVGNASESREGSSPKKFKPQPVEMTSKSNRRKGPADSTGNEDIKPRSRFAPEPVDISKRSNRLKQSEGESRTTTQQFKPEPVEAIAEGIQNEHQRGDALSQQRADDQVTLPEQPAAPKPAPRKKFTPQLLETTRRSRRKGDPGPALKVTDKTEHTPGDPPYKPRYLPVKTQPSLLPIPPDKPLNSSSERSPQSSFVEGQRGHSVYRNTRREHSWMPPTLEPIESSESEPEDEQDEGKVPSLSTSPSASSSGTDAHKLASRRESCDDRFSGYMLDLAARAAEKQLREQAMAAYPNDDHHEPVDHFAFDRESNESEEDEADLGYLTGKVGGDINMMRRESEADAALNLAEMRRHQQNLDTTTRNNLGADVRQNLRSDNPFSMAAAYQLPDTARSDASGAPKHIVGGWQRDIGIEQMRNAASPPMLGRDLKFRKCPSPQETKLDVDQYHSRGEGCTRRLDGKGLWNGYCAVSANKGDACTKLSTGLMTPSPEKDSYFTPKNHFIIPKSHRPPSPEEIEEQLRVRSLDEMMSGEEEDEEEFSAAFTTQVYNYLSLGYPSLARKFDAELSKISGVPLEDLSKDDHLANKKGYVGLPEGLSAGLDSAHCINRWRALDLYIKEWVKQHGGEGESQLAIEAWGVCARRGSWAI